MTTRVKAVQLTLRDDAYVPPAKPRGGAIGKVERCITERPWLTCGEIAAVVHEPSTRVSECLNKLKLEGRAQARQRLGQSKRSVWAGTDDAGQELRERRLTEVVNASSERADNEAALRVTVSLSRAWERAGAITEGADA